MSLATVITLCSLACIATVLSHPFVDGRIAELGQFPHQVSLRCDNRHFCSGSIISPLKVLTSAYCVIDLSIPSITAVVGTNMLNSSGVAHSVSSVSHHESYDPETTVNVNDVGIVTLTLPIQYNEFVQAIRLATSIPSPGETVTLSGWGTRRFPDRPTNVLQFLDLEIMDIQTCAEKMMAGKPITTGHVCTKSPKGEGSCLSDPGSPLITAEGVQVGIVSFGLPCARGYPDVYSSVAFHNSWIQSH